MEDVLKTIATGQLCICEGVMDVVVAALAMGRRGYQEGVYHVSSDQWMPPGVPKVTNTLY